MLSGTPPCSAPAPRGRALAGDRGAAARQLQRADRRHAARRRLCLVRWPLLRPLQVRGLRQRCPCRAVATAGPLQGRCNCCLLPVVKPHPSCFLPTCRELLLQEWVKLLTDRVPMSPGISDPLKVCNSPGEGPGSAGVGACASPGLAFSCMCCSRPRASFPADARLQVMRLIITG